LRLKHSTEKVGWDAKGLNARLKVDAKSLLLKVDPAGSEVSGRYSYYLFVASLFFAVVSLIGLTNAYLHYVNISSYYSYQREVLRPFSLTGYSGMFVIVAFAPLPDYLIIPLYGYLSAIGIFNIYLTFAVSVSSMLFEMGIEYAGGRFGGRPLLLKVLSKFHITEGDIEFADNWIAKHGPVSIFLATFIPYFKNVTSIAAGTLRMNAFWFFLSNLAGFGLRFAFLLYIGYRSIYVLTPGFDYHNRNLLFLVAALSCSYIALYMIRKTIKIRRKIIASYYKNT